MRDLGHASYDDLFAWSVREREAFWGEMVLRTGVRFRTPPERILDPDSTAAAPRWLPGAVFNIAESCLAGASDSPAVVFRREGGPLETWTVGDLSVLSGRVAAGLVALGYAPGEAIAVDMPMTAESVAIYLGIVRAGCAVVSVADSFAPAEIESRLRISGATGIFTGDLLLRGGKVLPLYTKVVAAGAPRAFVVPAGERIEVGLREGDLPFEDLLTGDGAFETVPRGPDDVINVLFSSGTTGDPKAIPWTQTTPLKCAADGMLHQDVRVGDVVAWPTNLGWMMGPWLLFASLQNRAAIGLFYGAPTGRAFGEFVEDAGVTMLGLVPSLVKIWRATGCMDGLDWSTVRAFSSTGEASNPDDMRWLMALPGEGGRPVIEYCGGTEIGGAYVTGTVVQPCAPGTFTTPALGLDFRLLDGEGRPADVGEVFLVPPSVGLSTRLLNRDHHEVYHEDVPPGPDGETLRRHGDRMERLPGGFYRALGRTDDTMNLGGIKVSSAEIERVLAGVPGVTETAAVAVPPPGGGPERLLIFAVLTAAAAEPDELRDAFQTRIRERLNPLFKVHEVRPIDSLPRTASNKVMRRLLRG